MYYMLDIILHAPSETQKYYPVSISAPALASREPRHISLFYVCKFTSFLIAVMCYTNINPNIKTV